MATLATIESTQTTDLATLDSRLQAVIIAWLVEVEQRTGSPRTPAEYRTWLGRFLKLVGDPATATPEHVHAFAYAALPYQRTWTDRDGRQTARTFAGKPPSPSTVNVRLAAVRSFYDFAQRMGLLDRNPVDRVKRPRLPEPTPRGLSADELRQLLAAIPNTPSGRRDRAIILTSVLTGLRRTEVLSLRAGDLEPKNGTLYYRVRVKGGSERFRELPRPAAAAIWAAGIDVDQLPADEPLFAISSPGFAKNLKRYADQAGLPGVTPHVLRHASAKLRRETGASIEQVSGFLGHKNLATTSRYLARLEGEQDTGWQAVATLLGVDDGAF